VDLLIVQRTELGYKVLIDNKYWGIIYQNETYADVNIGERHMGFVRQVRPDGKVDVTLAKIEKMRVDDLSTSILDYLKQHGGTMSLTDKSSPEDIQRVFQCSKKDFKKALGQLYKQHLVTLGETVTLI
jgi:predicted RNA-binding protein (virulence factor B family)